MFYGISLELLIDHKIIREALKNETLRVLRDFSFLCQFLKNVIFIIADFEFQKYKDIVERT